jgi:GNAT superfamily N-acetyltransferase
MNDLELEIHAAADQDVSDVIEARMSLYNKEQSGISDCRPLIVAIREPHNVSIIGGLNGRTSLGLLFIDLLFIPEPFRSGGLGSRVLRMAETEAINRGCCAAVLCATSFQAPSFYERHGYQRFGEIACLPRIANRIFMSKPFTSPSPFARSNTAASRSEPQRDTRHQIVVAP